MADDLTGAADCGVACARRGLRTLVLLGDDVGGAEADVLSVDAETRPMPPEQAAAETARLVQRYIRDARNILYKKLDSTLRGNVAAELAAALEVRRALATQAVPTAGRIVAVLAPAFPANGRTTVNGRMLVYGKPLEETELWQYEPMAARSNIAEILGEAHLRPALASLDAIRSSGLRETMTALAQEADVLVCDAETDADLRAIADASMALGHGTVWAGSAGLAYHLPPAAGLLRCSTPAASAMVEEPPAAGPVLFVIGSGSRVSREQAEALVSRSDVLKVEIAADVLLAGRESSLWRAHESMLEEALRKSNDVAVLPGSAPRLEKNQGPLLAAALAEMARPFAGAAGALVATGGETARAVFEAWGICRLRIVGEVEAGLPYAIAEGWRRRLPVLTKAGGFGSPETLLHCRQFLRELMRSGAAHSNPSKGVQ